MGAMEWVFIQDLAWPRDCPNTKERIKAEGVKLLSWMPSGADLNPLNVYVNNYLKTVLKNKDLKAIKKLKSGMAIAPGKVLGRIAKTCCAFPKRVRWVAENFGKKVIRKKANEVDKENEAALKNDVVWN